MMLLAALVAVFTTAAIVYILVSESLPFFRQVSLHDFFTDTLWTPMFDQPHFGIMPLVAGTLVTTLVALCLAIPCGTIIAIYLSEFAAHRLREVVKPAIELLSEPMEKLQLAGAEILRQQGPSAGAVPGTIAALTKGLSARSAEVRTTCMDALIAMGPAAAPATARRLTRTGSRRTADQSDRAVRPRRAPRSWRNRRE